MVPTLNNPPASTSAYSEKSALLVAPRPQFEIIVGSTENIDNHHSLNGSDTQQCQPPNTQMLQAFANERVSKNWVEVYALLLSGVLFGTGIVLTASFSTSDRDEQKATGPALIGLGALNAVINQGIGSLRHDAQESSGVRRLGVFLGSTGMAAALSFGLVTYFERN